MNVLHQFCISTLGISVGSDVLWLIVEDFCRSLLPQFSPPPKEVIMALEQWCQASPSQTSKVPTNALNFIENYFGDSALATFVSLDSLGIDDVDTPGACNIQFPFGLTNDSFTTAFLGAEFSECSAYSVVLELSSYYRCVLCCCCCRVREKKRENLCCTSMTKHVESLHSPSKKT